MFVKNINDCQAFTANDGCEIREWVHPANDPVELSYSIATATVAVGEQSYKHYLKQAEVYLITAGEGLMHVGDEQQQVTVGDSILVPAHSTQWIENTGKEKLEFIAVVSPPWCEEDDIRIT